MLSNAVIAIRAIKSILHLLPVVADIFRLSLSSIFRGFYHHGLTLIGNKTACFFGIARSELKLKKISACYILGIVGNIAPTLCAFNKSAEITDKSLLGICVKLGGIAIFRRALKVKYFNTVFFDFDFLGDEINSVILAVNIYVNIQAGGSLSHTDGLTHTVDNLVSNEGVVLVVSNQAPTLGFTHSEKVGGLAQLDVIRLFCHSPCGVSSALD